MLYVKWMHTVYADIRIIAHSSTIKMPLSEMQKKVARESFLHHGPKKHECKKCRKIVTSDSAALGIPPAKLRECV